VIAPVTADRFRIAGGTGFLIEVALLGRPLVKKVSGQTSEVFCCTLSPECPLHCCLSSCILPSYSVTRWKDARLVSRSAPLQRIRA